MTVVKRRRDAVDALEHAMRGVQTTEERGIESSRDDPRIMGKRSEVRIDLAGDDTPVEHEVTIVMRKRPRREHLR